MIWTGPPVVCNVSTFGAVMIWRFLASFVSSAKSSKARGLS